MTWANVLGSCMAIAGVTLFQRTMAGWNFRPVFWITTIVKCTASFIDIIIVNRELPRGLDVTPVEIPPAVAIDRFLLAITAVSGWI